MHVLINCGCRKDLKQYRAKYIFDETGFSFEPCKHVVNVRSIQEQSKSILKRDATK